MIDLLRSIYRYENGNLYRNKTSGGMKAGSVAGWQTICNGKPYKKINLNYKTYYLHQIIYAYHYGFIPKYIDHKDGNSLNNCIENLREATQSQNAANCKIVRKNNTSGHKGVVFVKNKWRAAIMINGKNKALGVFVNKQDAINAYKEGAVKFFQEFAKV